MTHEEARGPLYTVQTRRQLQGVTLRTIVEVPAQASAPPPDAKTQPRRWSQRSRASLGLAKLGLAKRLML